MGDRIGRKVTREKSALPAPLDRFGDDLIDNHITDHNHGHDYGQHSSGQGTPPEFIEAVERGEQVRL
jgi:hypothetical protein